MCCAHRARRAQHLSNYRGARCAHLWNPRPLYPVGEGRGEGFSSTLRCVRVVSRTLTHPSPGVPVEGKEMKGPMYQTNPNSQRDGVVCFSTPCLLIERTQTSLSQNVSSCHMPADRDLGHGTGSFGPAMSYQSDARARP